MRVRTIVALKTGPVHIGDWKEYSKCEFIGKQDHIHRVILQELKVFSVSYGKAITFFPTWDIAYISLEEE